MTFKGFILAPILMALASCGGGGGSNKAANGIISADDNVLLAGMMLPSSVTDAGELLPIEGFAGTLQIEGETYPTNNWVWQISQSGTTHVGAGGGAGKANVGNLFVVRPTDSLAVLMVGRAASGAHIESIELASGTTQFIARNVIVVGVTTGPTAYHTLEFNFEEFTYTVDGESTCFNVAQNNSC